MAPDIQSELPDVKEGFEWLPATKAAARMDITTQTLSKEIKYWEELVTKPEGLLSKAEAEDLKKVRRVFKSKNKVFIELPKEENPLAKPLEEALKTIEALSREKEILNNDIQARNTQLQKWKDNEAELLRLQEEVKAFKGEKEALNLTLNSYKAMGLLDRIKWAFTRKAE